ncbi:hypothetical protein SEUCBS139899_001816 [Sporothrix eucalyptigena]|uniref:Small ribosomal subunit protein bS18m n=1 Tax=Sporothrix eucalyptigena TaxID=1812306 RepID=A0ABP0CRD7_9PEZI
MPPRLPTSLVAASSRCSSFFTAPFAQRFAVASLHSTASLSGPRQLPHSSGASFLDLDNEGAKSADSSSPSSSNAQSQSRAPRFFGSGNARNSDANAALSSVLFSSESRRVMYERREERKRSALERMAERKVTEDYARQLPRRWKQGDLYSPMDLDPRETKKWKKAYTNNEDIVDLLGINPVDEYRNFSMISDFMSGMGRIRHSNETGLRPVNQRRMAKAIRRAIGLGIHPSVHKHPEILAASMANMPKPAYASTSDSRKKSAFRV